MIHLNKYKNKKLFASSLIEVLVALSILSICSTLLMLTLIRIQRANPSQLKLKAIELATQQLNESYKNRNTSETSVVIENLIVNQTTVTDSYFADCDNIFISVYTIDRDKLVELNYSLKKQ